MPDVTIQTLFASDIHRSIEEVIKVDQTREEIVDAEIGEYVVTSALRNHYEKVFDRYSSTRNKPHERIGVWVSGFFGSGKSSFAKMLGLAIGNARILGKPAARLVGDRVGDAKNKTLLAGIVEQVPTHTVVFDVSTDRGIKSGNQTLTEIMYRLYLQSLGYAKDLDLSELEISLEEAERLDEFKTRYGAIFKKDWDTAKGKVSFALSEASRVMHELEPDTYPMADSWVKAIKDRNDITAGRLAERCTELMARRGRDQNLLFVIDEVGQFVARDVQKMLDLQAVVQSLGRVGRGKHWLVVTSQEKLNELVGGLDDRRIELARLMDRFATQVHLEPSDISEVTSRRVLSKNAQAQGLLRQLFEANRGRLTQHTRLTADITLPELAAEGFVDLYPLLPYQIDLIIQVVSGLRTQGGASRHVGGANRTIIKLAQQLLINPGVNLAAQPVGRLVTIDRVYDLVEQNITGEVRGKIAAIAKQVPHPMAQSVAKAICLLQFVKSIHRTAENIAAALHPAVDADSCLPSVKEALDQLIRGHQIRLGEDGYRIPTPAEDDWERDRMALVAKGGDTTRILSEAIHGFWQPQPSHVLLDTKTFKAGLALHGRTIIDGDMMVHMSLADAGKPFTELVDELRKRSQQEKNAIFWAVPLDGAIGDHCQELFRSQQMIARKEREVRTSDESALIGEEKVRLRRHQDEVRRLLKGAALAGQVFFQGNDRSPGDGAADVGKAGAAILGQALPDVFSRFKEAAAKVQKKDIDALLTSENLHGLTPVFASLGLLRNEKGKPVFKTDSGPLGEVLARIENRTSYGETASGKYLADDLAKEPFGWDFEVVRLLVLSLLRAGKLEATSKSQTFDSALSVEAKETFSNNNLFRQAAFRPKVGIDFEQIVHAADNFQKVFGKEIKELEQGVITAAIREELSRAEENLQTALTTLNVARLPGADVLEGALDQMRAMRRGSEGSTIGSFNASWSSVKEAVKRAAELERELTAPRLKDLERAAAALSAAWVFLRDETDLHEAVTTAATELEDLLQRETFFKELPAIDQHARVVEQDYAARYDAALEARTGAYTVSLEQLEAMPEWAEIDEVQRKSVAAPLLRSLGSGVTQPIPQIRSDTDACAGRLQAARKKLMEIVAGERLATVRVADFFPTGIETEEELDSALAEVREKCAKLIGAGKKVLVQ